MAANSTTNIDKIAQKIVSLDFDSSSVNAGSYWNPDRRTKNCVFVSLGFLLGMSAPELSRKTGVLQPRNESRGLSNVATKMLLQKSMELGFFAGYSLSQDRFRFNARSREPFLSRSRLVFYHPKGDFRYGHCVVSQDISPIYDYQNSQGMAGRNVDREVFPFGKEGPVSNIAFTIDIMMQSDL